MSTQNFYALLGDDENEDPTAVIDRATTPAAAADKQQSAAAVAKKQQQQPSVAPAKLPAKHLPSADAVNEGQRPFPYEGGGRGRGGRLARGGGRGGSTDRGNGGNDRPLARNGETDGVRSYVFDRPLRGEDGDLRSSDVGGRGRGRGRGRDHRERVFTADGEDRPRRREFDRHSGSGRGHEMKRDGAGRGNWGTDGDQVEILTESTEAAKEDDKLPGDLDEKKVENEVQLDHAGEEPEEKREDNEMTLDEYEKILEEKKKALSSNKAEERKVKADKAFETMHLVDRKNDNDVFIKLGTDKDKGKKKESMDKEEKTRKVVSINEFLKPADGERYYGGRGRGRGRGDRGGFRGGFGGAFGSARRVSAPRIEDPGQFPTLSGV